MTAPERDATLTKRRIEACVKQAQMNARTIGGNNATAAMDLLCAFVLICNKTGAPVDKVLVETIANAIICVDDFWPKRKGELMSDLETCGKCMGSGYRGHPDSKTFCADCGGSGGVQATPAPDVAELVAELVSALREASQRLSWFGDKVGCESARTAIAAWEGK